MRSSNGYLAAFSGMDELSVVEMTQFLGECGIEISEFTSILDFGCGCGRVTRFFRGLDRATIHGSDYNPRLVSWCKENLTFAEFDTNDLAPPLRYKSDSFDFIFMVSVFTHLDEELQKAWMNELKRVLAPGGYIYFTTHGEKYLHLLDTEQRGLFLDGALVVIKEASAGQNICSAIESRRFVEDNLLSGFEMVRHIPGCAEGFGGQDIFIITKNRSS